MNKYTAIAGVVAMVASFFFGAHYNDRGWQTRWQERNANDAIAAQHAQEQARTTESLWQSKLDEVSKNASKQIEDVRRTERAAANDRVRSAAKEYANRGSKDSCPTNGSTPDRIQVLADLLADADELAELMAVEADEARIRGVACESAYDALSSPKQ